VSVNCQSLKNIVAFEFNSQSFQVLTNNLSNFSQQAQCVNAAISDFDGFAKFHADTDRLNDQEGSIDNNIESSGAGDTLVTILDNWWINQVKQNQFLVEKIIMLIEVHPQVKNQ
jgi:dGTP triphosphohydrolase